MTLHNYSTTSLFARGRICILLLLTFLIDPNYVDAQQRNTLLKIYGHLQYNFDGVGEAGADSYFSLGEQDFFVTSNLSNRISFLGETVV
ncbi:MAG: hypothetical protein ACKO7B_18455 [Flavobacteriales bacterium]